MRKFLLPAANDTIDGGAGNDTLLGMAGADQIAGGDGDDFLAGNSGNRTIWLASRMRKGTNCKMCR